MNFQNNYFPTRLFRTYFLLAAGMTGLMLHSASYASIVVNDSFSDGNRTVQSLPLSADWHLRAGDSTASASSNSLTFDLAAAPDNGVVGYFTHSGAIDLAIGQSISLSFDLTVNASQPLSSLGNRLRFGLMNSGGSRETNDGSNFNSGTYSNYEGYWGVISANPNATSSSIRERSGVDNRLPTTDAMTTLGTTFLHETIQPNTTYQFTLEVLRTGADANMITTTIDGLSGSNSFTRMDTTSIFSSFDTAVISLHDFDASSATIGNITVSTVPEPSTLAIWSLGSLALLLRRRTLRAPVRFFSA